MARASGRWPGPGPGSGREPPPPAPPGRTALVAAHSLRLAWEVNPRRLAGVVALHLVGAAADLALLRTGRVTLEAVLAPGGGRPPPRVLVVATVLGVASQLSRVAGGLLLSPLGEAVSRQAEARVLSRVVGLELAQVEDPDVQDAVQRALGASQNEANLLRQAVELIPAGARLASALVALGSGDRALVPLAVVGIVPQWLAGRSRSGFHGAHRSRGPSLRDAGVLRHYLVGAGAAHETRLFGSGEWLRRHYEEAAEAASRADTTWRRDQARRRLTTTLASRAASAPATLRLGWRAATGRSTAAAAVAGGTAQQRVTAGLSQLVAVTTDLRRMASEVAEGGKELPSPPAPGNGPAPAPGVEAIVVRNLSFTYPGSTRPVLAEVSLAVRRGEVVALVGENGSGKTTLAKILCTLYRPDSGSVHWDGIDVFDCDPAAVRDLIAAVFQDFERYPSLTAAENIGIGRPSLMGDRAAVEAAARRAGIHDVLASLPDGYDTRLARPFGGRDLSLGQWQRLALARAFLRDAPFVVLDEPTAALDPRAERALFETVAGLYRDRAALLISHRLSSVRFADRICVLAGGRIVEQGTHDELVGGGGAYAELFELQARAYR